MILALSVCRSRMPWSPQPITSPRDCSHKPRQAKPIGGLGWHGRFRLSNLRSCAPTVIIFIINAHGSRTSTAQHGAYLQIRSDLLGDSSPGSSRYWSICFSPLGECAVQALRIDALASSDREAELSSLLPAHRFAWRHRD